MRLFQLCPLRHSWIGHPPNIKHPLKCPQSWCKSLSKPCFLGCLILRGMGLLSKAAANFLRIQQLQPQRGWKVFYKLEVVMGWEIAHIVPLQSLISGGYIPLYVHKKLIICPSMVGFPLIHSHIPSFSLIFCWSKDVKALFFMSWTPPINYRYPNSIPIFLDHIPILSPCLKGKHLIQRWPTNRDVSVLRVTEGLDTPGPGAPGASPELRQARMVL
jgi:hypothetical protein